MAASIDGFPIGIITATAHLHPLFETVPGNPIIPGNPVFPVTPASLIIGALFGETSTAIDTSAFY